MKKNILIIVLVVLLCLALKIPNNVSVKYGAFDESDIENIKQFVMEWETPTRYDFVKYDITKDGLITQMDWFYASRMVKGVDPNPRMIEYSLVLEMKN